MQLWRSPAVRRALHTLRSRGSIALEAFPQNGRSVTLCDPAAKLLKIVRADLLNGRTWDKIADRYAAKVVQARILEEVLKHVRCPWLACLLFSWAQQKKKCSPTLQTYQCLLEAFVRGGGSTVGYSKYLEMASSAIGHDEYAFCLAIASEIKLSDGFTEAFSKLKERTGSDLTITTDMFNVVTEGACKENNLEMAREVYAMMKSVVQPNLCSYKIMIKAFGLEHRVSEARLFFDKMIAEKIEPDAATYGMLVEIYSGVFMQEEAAQFLNLMLAKGHRPRAETFSALIRCYLDNWNAASGYEVFRKMEELGYELTGSLYHEMLHGFWDSRMIDETRMLMREMLSKGFKPSATVYSNLTVAFACPGREDEAVNVFNELLEAGYAPGPETCKLLVRRFSKMDRTSHALDIYEKMVKFHKPDQGTFQEIAACLCRAEQVEVAHRLLNQVVREFKNMIPNVETYNSILSRYCSFGLSVGLTYQKSLQIQKALELFDEMVNMGRWPNIDTFNIVIHGLCKGGRAMDAYQLFLTIKDFNLAPDAATSKTVIMNLCSMDKIVEAELVFDHLMAEKRQANESGFVVSQVYKVIVAAKSRVAEASQGARSSALTEPSLETAIPLPSAPIAEESLGW